MDLNGPIAIDVADEPSVNAAFTSAKTRSTKLDLLVVTAGIVDNSPTVDLSPARWARVLAVNLTGPFLCCRAALGWLADGGRIVLFGSLSGRTGALAISSVRE